MGLRILRSKRATIPGLIILLVALLGSWPLVAAPILVRFAEGSIHGFIVLHTPEGRSLAQGDLLGVARGAEIQRTTVFRFKDGSLFEETVVFSQQGVYRLQSYRLEQRGPAFTHVILGSFLWGVRHRASVFHTDIRLISPYFPEISTETKSVPCPLEKRTAIY